MNEGSGFRWEVEFEHINHVEVLDVEYLDRVVGLADSRQQSAVEVAADVGERVCKKKE